MPFDDSNIRANDLKTSEEENNGGSGWPAFLLLVLRRIKQESVKRRMKLSF